MSTEDTTSPAESVVSAPAQEDTNRLSEINDARTEAKTEKVLGGEAPARQFGTTFAYRLFVLVSASYPVLQVVFMSMFLGTWWFQYDLSLLVIPTVLLCLPVAHILLLMQEAPGGCRFFFFLRKGMPLFIYRKWLMVSDSAVAIGRRQIAIDLVDEVWLTAFGNLHLRSRTIRGKGDLLKFRFDEQSDLLLRVPMGVITLQDQRDFIALLKERKPQILTNSRLEKRLETPILPGADRLPLLGSIFIFFVLFDAGQALFGHLEILKNYYHSEVKAQEGDTRLAEEYFQKGESVRAQKLKWSWVYGQFMAKGRLEADLLNARADVLTRLKRYREALDSLNQAQKEVPGSLKTSLRTARLLYQTGDFKGARAELTSAIEEHKSSFLARLYMIALYRSAGKDATAESFFRIYRQELNDEVYGEEPAWPPGGQRFVHDLWFSEDLDFVFGKLFKTGK